MERARDGDPQAFARLYGELRGRVHGTAARMLGDQHEAEDAVQDTFLTAYRKLDRLQDCQSFEAWLLSIARNTALNRLRVRARCGPSQRVHDEELDTLPSLPRVMARSGASEVSPFALAALRSEFAALPREVRVTVLLHYVRGLSCSQIAGRTGLTTSAIKTRLHRARVQLRAAVEMR